MATQASIEQVQRAYISYYNRPGDPGGVEYWAGRLDGGEDFEVFMNAFATSPEAEALYAGISTADLIATVYNQAFGRTPDAEGLDYWAESIDSGEITPGEALLAIVEGANSGDDLAIIQNKVSFAVTVTNSFASDAEYDANSVGLAELMSSITTDISTISTALEGLFGAQQGSLIGSWIALPNEDIGKGTYLEVKFFEDGTYYLWESTAGEKTPEGAGPDNLVGHAGEEVGTYEWDEANGLLTINDIISDGNSEWGFNEWSGGGRISFSLEGSTLLSSTLNITFIPGDETNSDPVPESDVLSGVWSALPSEDIGSETYLELRFYEDGTYYLWESKEGDTAPTDAGPDNLTGHEGEEAGHYGWDEENSLLTILDVTSDQNSDWGFNEWDNGGQITLQVVGSNLVFPTLDLTFVSEQ